MSKEEKQVVMDRVMEKFFADMTPQERGEMMMGMMPKMMAGMMENMSSVMGEGIGGETQVSDEMFEMMRTCCGRMGFELKRREERAGSQN